MGLLADKFSPTDAFAEGDFRRGWTTDPEQHEQFLADLETVAELRSLVPEGQSMAQLALRFVLDPPASPDASSGQLAVTSLQSNPTRTSPHSSDAGMPGACSQEKVCCRSSLAFMGASCRCRVPDPCCIGW
jgi:hypothetical protein